MARIQEHIIENVRETADIHDVVSEYVNLKKRGRNFFGLCPFHDEKTPSFSINIDKQIYKFFGCGKGGGTINFIMDLERLDFVDAVKFLGNKYNIEVEIQHNSKSSNDVFNQIYKMNEIANDFFTSNINDIVKNLLFKRKIEEESINTFKIGLSPNNYDQLLTIIRKEKFSAEALKKSELFVETDKGYVDRFRNRIMFPIFNQFDKIIGFSGRVIDKNDKRAKFVNSPNTPVYNKSKTLYGMNLNKNNIIDCKSVIIVEGYLDLIQLNQAGFNNVLAVCGTAFTDQHAVAISRLCKNIFLAYDGDKAGKDAAIRAGHIILKNNMNPTIVPLPDNLDPDDWIQKEGKEPFRNAIQNSESVLSFQYNLESSFFESDQDRIDFVNKIIDELLKIENPLKFELCIKELSEVTSFNIETIMKTVKLIEAKKNRFKKNTPTIKQATKKIKTEKIAEIEKELINFCFAKDSKLRKLIKENLDLNWLESIKIKEIYSKIYIHLSSEEMVIPEVVTQELLDENLRNLMSYLTIKDMEPSKNIITDCLSRIEKKYLKNKMNTIRMQLKSENINESEEKELLEKIMKIQKQKINILTKYNEI